MFIDPGGNARYKATRKGYDEKVTTSMTDARPSRADLQRIRRLFAHAHPSYSVAESAALLGLAETVIERELENGSITALRFGGETRIAWTDLVWLGLLHRWTHGMLTVAVRGGRAAALLPPLVRVVPGRLLLPRYQWRVLALLAAERRREEGRAWSASDLVEEAISDFIVPCVDDWNALEAINPGLRAASDWPARDFEEATRESGAAPYSADCPDDGTGVG